MKKSELIKKIEALEKLFNRVEVLESMQENDRNNIKKIKDDIFSKGTVFLSCPDHLESGVPTHKKIEKILEHLGIEIYETASEIKVRSTKPRKKKGKKK